MMTTEGHTCYARNDGGNWHIVPGFARSVYAAYFGQGVCGKIFRVYDATDAIRETGDAPACPACLRYFYRMDDKRP